MFSKLALILIHNQNVIILAISNHNMCYKNLENRIKEAVLLCNRTHFEAIPLFYVSRTQFH